MGMEKIAILLEIVGVMFEGIVAGIFLRARYRKRQG